MPYPCTWSLLFTASHSFRSSPSGRTTACRRLPEPSLPAATRCQCILPGLGPEKWTSGARCFGISENWESAFRTAERDVRKRALHVLLELIGACSAVSGLARAEGARSAAARSGGGGVSGPCLSRRYRTASQRRPPAYPRKLIACLCVSSSQPGGVGGRSGEADGNLFAQHPPNASSSSTASASPASAPDASQDSFRGTSRWG